MYVARQAPITTIAYALTLLLPAMATAQVTLQVMDVRYHDEMIKDTVGSDLTSAFNDAQSRVYTDSCVGATSCSNCPTCDVACAEDLGDFDILFSWQNFTSFDCYSDINSIDSEGEYRHIMDVHPGYVRLVDAVNWCGSQNATFAACADTNAELGFVGEDGVMAGSLGGIMVAHEFGHTVGLGHSTATNNIMRATFSTANNRLTSGQCDNYQETVNQNGCTSYEEGCCGFAAGGGDESGAEAGEEGGGVLDFTGIPIAQLAMDGFIDYVPVEVESFYDQRDVTALKQMLRAPALLKDAARRREHRTILSLIGLISDGNDGDVSAIVDFIADTGVDPTPAGIALGYIVSRTGNDSALRHLLKMSSGVGRERIAGIMGLGLSGHGEALARLDEIERLGNLPEEAQDVLIGAVDNNYRIGEAGLAAYYRSH